MADWEQKREYVRVEATLRVDIVSLDGDPPFSSDTLNISGGGLLLSCDELDIGARFDFRLHLGNGQPPIEGRARVVRPCDEGRRGAMFEQIAATDRQRLIRFIFDRQRAALAKTRVK